MQPKIESNMISIFSKKTIFINKNKMKQLHNIFNQYSRLHGQEPKGCVCIFDSEFMDERCLYKRVC